MMKFGLLLLVSLLFVGLAAGRQWEDGDTIIVDPFVPEDELPRVKREGVLVEEIRSEDPDTVLIRSEGCITVRGKSGRCMTLKECYPLLSPNDPNSPPSESHTLNDPLADQLIASTGLCNGYQYRSGSDSSLFLQVARSEVLICCALQPRIAPPLPPPPANATEDDIEAKAGCGTVKNHPGTGSVLPKVSDLGEAESQNRTNENKIVNGREAKKGEFPWIVAMMNSGREFCGGSLIDDKTVLTAAHCVQHMGSSDVQKLTIQIGDHDIYSTSDARHEVRTAARILYHKDFSMQHLHHDVALVILNKPVPTNGQYIKSVCMHDGSPSSDNQDGQVAGWGQLRDGGPQPSKLQTANVKIWSNAECSKRYGSNAPAGIGNGMVCAGGSGRDSCRGDSGGPLTINTSGTARQVGIVSWGIGCGSYPGVYTRVEKYIPWISKNRRRSFAE